MKLSFISKLGDGATADVWLATDDLDREVAVKIVRQAASGSSDAISHARALARAAHLNVVSVIAIETVTDPESGALVDAVVMERLSGKTLDECLSGPKLSIAEVRRIGISIIDGLTHIHSQGLEHGDLHEKNVIVSASAVKVIDILYRDSLAALSSNSRTARIRRDLTSLRLLLQQVIAHSDLGAAQAVELSRTLDSGSPLPKIMSAFLAVTEPENLKDAGKALDNAYALVLDVGFVEGEEYASALSAETATGVIPVLLKRIIAEKTFRPVHRSYMSALWKRLKKADREGTLEHLGNMLTSELPNGNWRPLLGILYAFKKEGWQGLKAVVRLRLEKLLTNDVLTGHIDIHSPISLGPSGKLGVYARLFWPYFKNPKNLADNVVSMLLQNWYTQNYIGEYFLQGLPRLAEATGTEDEIIDALAVACRNDAKVIVNSLAKLPDGWRTRIKERWRVDTDEDL